jgi:sulfopyruvate decarboxylase subunit alpha
VSGLPHLPSANLLADTLLRPGLGPCFATPCGVLAPLLDALRQAGSLRLISREENAIGVAVGASLAGRASIVLMQNSGFGASVNALASLVLPYSIPIVLLISLRGTASDATAENAVMGSVTGPFLDLLGIPHRTLSDDTVAEHAAWAATVATDERRAAALLVPPHLFGWRPA